MKKIKNMSVKEIKLMIAKKEHEIALLSIELDYASEKTERKIGFNLEEGAK